MNTAVNSPPMPPKVKHLGMRAKRAVGSTVGQTVLSALALLWIIPLVYLFVQSFRAEPGAWS